MSVTTYGVNDSLSNKLWAKKLSAEALKETYFGKFMGSGSDNMIHMKSETTTNAGDAVTFGLRMQLSGDGVTESQSLVGNEESLSTYSDKIVINELAHAVHVGTAFNAGTTNVLTVGTNASAYNNIMLAADADETAAGAITNAIKPSGTALGPLAADARVFVMYTQTGTAATAGSAIVLIHYVPDTDL
jgi:hypothetical protein